ncbi:MAG: zinc-ribbon domain-containing protein [Clostridia bacterium]|nr:zinc-ribbon domain-containing protein [Clostridia bacterium]
MYCERCGSPNVDGSVFCAACGSPMNQQPIQQVVEKRKNKWPLLIVSIVLLVSLIAGMVFVVFSITANGDQGVKECLSNFETCYNNSDIDGLIECFNDDTQDVVNAAVGLSSEFFGVDTSKILSIVLGFGTEISGYKNLNIEVENITKETKTSAIADTTFDFGDKQFEISLSLTKENGKWYISGLK